MGNLAFIEKVPFIFSIFVAALSWTVVRTVDGLAGIPIIEYRVDFEDSHEKSTAKVRLRNITSDTVFPCVEVMLARATGSKVSLDNTQSVVPKLRGTVYVDLQHQPLVENDHAVFRLKEFGPGADVEYSIRIKDGKDLRLLTRNCVERKVEDDKHHEPAHIVLLPCSFKTFFVEHELSILWWLLFVWLAAMIILAYFSGRSSKGHRRGV